MGLSPILWILISLFYTVTAKREDYCLLPSAFECASATAIIRFPFSTQQSCAYPGFNMSCNEMNRAVIQVGSWGEFAVRDVNYISQEVQIYDQDNCLPKRLLNLDLSGSPFEGAHYENFTFFSCSSEFSSNNSKPISCLGSLNHSVYATSSINSESEMLSSCDLIKSVMVPSRPRRHRADVKDDVHLIWYTPDCRECAVKYGNCGFANRESNDIQCSLPRPPGQQSLPDGAKYAIALGVCIPILLGIILIACLADRKATRLRRGESTSSVVQQQPMVSVVGLDESVLQSYPITVLGESRRLVNPEDSTCSICLSEYRPKETLKTIPECKHCFHSTCIDEWLRKSVTCPICRNLQTPLQVPI